MTSVETSAVAALSPAQQRRRERIIDAAAALAAEGGFDAVQMRDVAERAGVALGTLYRYFPSKVHLLVSTLYRYTARLADELDRDPPRGHTAAQRVLDVLERGTTFLLQRRGLADAMIRALMVADASASEAVDAVDELATTMIVRAMHGDGGPPTAEERDVARMLEFLWWALLLAWLSDRSSPDELRRDIATAVRLLIRS